MPDVNPIAVIVAGVAGFAASGVYYSLVGDQLATVSTNAAFGDEAPGWTYAAEALRTLVLAAVVAVIVSLADVQTWLGGVAFGLILWIGFPLLLWIGAMLHERTPARLAVIHSGDWLLKLLIISAIIATLQ